MKIVKLIGAIILAFIAYIIIALLILTPPC